jgi:hypothetical protein
MIEPGEDGSVSLWPELDTAGHGDSLMSIIGQSPSTWLFQGVERYSPTEKQPFLVLSGLVLVYLPKFHVFVVVEVVRLRALEGSQLWAAKALEIPFSFAGRLAGRSEPCARRLGPKQPGFGSSGATSFLSGSAFACLGSAQSGGGTCSEA